MTAEGPRAYKQCLLSVKKRLNHRDPHVVLLALSLLDCLWNNCGAQFRREVSSKDFVGELNYKCTNVSSRTNTTKSGPSRGTKSGSKGTKGKEPKKYSKVFFNLFLIDCDEWWLIGQKTCKWHYYINSFFSEQPSDCGKDSLHDKEVGRERVQEGQFVVTHRKFVQGFAERRSFL